MGVLDEFRLDGRSACVTGGSRGLGLAMARGLAEAGADLVLVGRDPALLEAARESIAAETGRRVETLAADLGDPGAAEAAARRVVDDFGPIEILINNVGGRRIDTPTQELTLDDWRRIVDLNLTGAFVWSKVVGGAMLPRRRGRVINVASISGLVATRDIAGRAYEAAKGALLSFTRALAADWAPHGVNVNAIAPGAFLTDPDRRWFAQRPDLHRTIEGMIPMGRLGDPAEVAPLAVYLSSDASAYMTGATLIIDGGYTLW